MYWRGSALRMEAPQARLGLQRQRLPAVRRLLRLPLIPPRAQQVQRLHRRITAAPVSALRRKLPRTRLHKASRLLTPTWPICKKTSA
jgi:hypothetical protein